MKFDLKKITSDTPAGLLLHTASVVGILALISISYFYGYLPSTTNHGETITVPNVEGMHISELSNFLDERNLRYQISDSSYSAKHNPRTILKQYPPAGSKVKESRIISISLNRVTPPTVPLPNLIDGSLINAEAVLRGNELKRGKIEFVQGPFLNLVKQMKHKGREIPAGTRVPKGSVIDLVIEDGGNVEIIAPNVVGYTLEDAKIPILGSNLVIGNTTIIDESLSDENNLIIIKQNPEPGTRLRAGDAIDLWIGKATDTIDE